MTIITTKEYNANQEKFSGIVLNDYIITQRFIIQNHIHNNETYIIFKPYNELSISITMDEFRASVRGKAIKRGFSDKTY